MIRKATIEDIAGILSIYNDAILHTTAIYDYTPHTLDERTAWFKELTAAGWPLYVYEAADGLVAGFADYGSFRNWPAYKYTVEHSIYVHPDCRRQGIARALMKQLIGDADAHDYATMVAGIDSQNAGSIHLHEALGFQKVGTIQKAGYKFGRWLDLDFYQLMLTGPEVPFEPVEVP